MSEILRAVVERSKCDGCSECVSVCPVEAIVIKDNKAYIANTCIGCGACSSVCPQECIEVKLADEDIEWT